MDAPNPVGYLACLPADLISLSVWLSECVTGYRNRKRCNYPAHTLPVIMAAAPHGQKSSKEIFARQWLEASIDHRWFETGNLHGFHSRKWIGSILMATSQKISAHAAPSIQPAATSVGQWTPK